MDHHRRTSFSNVSLYTNHLISFICLVNKSVFDLFPCRIVGRMFSYVACVKCFANYKVLSIYCMCLFIFSALSIPILSWAEHQRDQVHHYCGLLYSGINKLLHQDCNLGTVFLRPPLSQCSWNCAQVPWKLQKKIVS